MPLWVMNRSKAEKKSFANEEQHAGIPAIGLRIQLFYQRWGGTDTNNPGVSPFVKSIRKGVRRRTAHVLKLHALCSFDT